MRLFIDTGFHENNVNAGEVLLPLAEIKNLKHLELHDHSCSSNNHLVTQSMIRNSKSTLQSLTLVNCRYGAHFLKDWEKNSRATTGAETAVIHTDRKGHDFTALKCLHLSSMSVDKNFVKEFERAFDFSRLRELELSDIIDPELLFYPFLTSLVTSYIGTTDISLSLRTLSLTMTDVRDFVSSRNTHEQKTASFEAKSRFLSSFDTLTTLVLRDYGLYSPQANANPGLSDVLLRAILKHKNLKVLRIPYNGVSSDEKIPYLSAATIGELVDGLPQLREIEFAPDEQQMEGIAKSLCRGSHIESVACFPYDSWSSYPPPDNPGFSILGPLLSAFLSNPKINLPPSSASKRFVWEDHYKLQRVRAAHNEWEVASKFGKRKINSGKNGGHFRTKEFKTEADGETREVLYRIIHKVFRVHVGYDDDFGWVSKADLELQ